MTKQTCYFLFLLFGAGCSRIHFDQSMPIETHVLKTFKSDLTGKYFYCDSILTIENKSPVYNLRFFPDIYKTKDSVALIAANVIVDDRRVMLEVNLKSYYKIA